MQRMRTLAGWLIEGLERTFSDGRDPSIKGVSRAEFEALPVKERIEIRALATQNRMQLLSTSGVLLGLLFTAAGLFYTARSLDTTQEGQITERYTRAIEQIGSDTLEGRVGAIYALERISRDSPRDQRTVVDVLATYVRERSPKKAKEKEPRIPADIQAALAVIARNKPAGTSPPTGPPWSAQHWVNLSGIRATALTLVNADLSGADLTDTDFGHREYIEKADGSIRWVRSFLDHANLSYADIGSSTWIRVSLSGANLTGASFAGSDLTNIDLSGARLPGASLIDAKVRYADLDGADLTGVDLGGVDFTGTHFRGADLTGAKWPSGQGKIDLRGADLSGAKGVPSAAVLKKIALMDDKTRL
ncbi:pentapeptide repeat-containing protein [Nonomuraea sp. NPDC051941]|uniref:pentapeptide repeat-containing protein n=1 Tax=Nonomuraea sp. NPDC051941 TaxID=3364373 RepID=UPI0037C539A4